MNDQLVIHYANVGMVIVLLLSMPPILVATIVGLLVSIFQAVTQLQEQTLSFAVKLIALIVTLVAVVPWAGAQMMEYTLQIFEQLPHLRQ